MVTRSPTRKGGPTDNADGAAIFDGRGGRTRTAGLLLPKPQRGTITGGIRGFSIGGFVV